MVRGSAGYSGEWSLLGSQEVGKNRYFLRPIICPSLAPCCSVPRPSFVCPDKGSRERATAAPRAPAQAVSGLFFPLSQLGAQALEADRQDNRNGMGESMDIALSAELRGPMEGSGLHLKEG